MIQFEEFYLDNGLHVVVHEDPSVQIAVVNILYDVGSRDEHPDKTGFAHLFEHLMFGGSVNIPNYDEPLQRVGGENNAFTNTDITNYYLTVPSSNIETGFWLESDRMMSLSFDPRVLEVQRKVVIEEFKQRYLNQPYGDVWLKLRPFVYQQHPYQWATIGKEVSHIENATMEDVREFFFTHYVPANAVLVVAGNVKTEQIKALSQKWFGPIPGGKKKSRSLPVEPIQKEKRRCQVKAKVPANAFYKAYPMPGRFDPEYYAVDLLSDMLGRGHSSRLYDQLVNKKELFSTISATITGSIDPGLLVFNGRLKAGVSFELAEQEVGRVINELIATGPTDRELEKVKNQWRASLEFGEVEVINRAMNLAFFSLSGNIAQVNQEIHRVEEVSKSKIQQTAAILFDEQKSNTMYYEANQ